MINDIEDLDFEKNSTDFGKYAIHNWTGFLTEAEIKSKKRKEKTNEEVVELILKYKQNPNKNFGKIYDEFSGYIYDLAKQYVAPAGDDWKDIVQQGVSGLIEGLNNYKFTENTNIRSYLLYNVKSNMLNKMGEIKDIVSLDRNHNSWYNRFEELKENLEVKYGRGFSNDEVIDFVEDFDLEKDKELVSSKMYYKIDILKKVPDLCDVLNTRELVKYPIEATKENCYECERLSKAVYDDFRNQANISLSSLDPSQREIIFEYMGLNGKEKKLEEIADEKNLTRDDVFAIKERGIRTLRHTSRSKNLRDYVEEVGSFNEFYQG